MGAKDAQDLGKTGTAVTSLLKSQEKRTPAQWAELTSLGDSAQQAVMMHICALEHAL